MIDFREGNQVVCFASGRVLMGEVILIQGNALSIRVLSPLRPGKDTIKLVPVTHVFHQTLDGYRLLEELLVQEIGSVYLELSGVQIRIQRLISESTLIGQPPLREKL